MWNIDSVANQVVMYLLLVVSFVVLLSGLIRHIEWWLRGKPSFFILDLKFSFKRFFTHSILQKKVARKNKAGVMHLLIYLGFFSLLFATTMVFLEHDLGIPVYHGRFYLGVTLFSDILGLGLALGCWMAFHRRLVSRDDGLHTTKSDLFFLGTLVLLCVQGFVLEAIRIHETNDPWAPYSPIGWLLSLPFSWISTEANKWIHFITWWFHTITVFAAFALLPYSKMFHLFASSANLFFHRPPEPKAKIQSTGDIEKLMETSDELTFGIGSIKDYSWKQLLDLDACTSCGRCQDVCPAYRSGKPLSPKWVIVDSRNHAYKTHLNSTETILPKPLGNLDSWLHNTLFTPSLNTEENERAKNDLVKKALLTKEGTEDTLIAGELMHQDVFWSCTTCMACVEACPVGIHHVEHIIENRRNLTLMRGEIPKEAQGMLRLLESQSNPFGENSERTKWMEGIDVPVLKPGDKVEYLYWIGCLSSFDKRKQQIAKSVIKLLNKAGVSYGIMGKGELCTGDPARRVGDEATFQMLAKQNVKALNEIDFDKTITNCPHCFNTLKNEYPEFGLKERPVLHHTQLFKQLLADGALSIPKLDNQSVTFHDPCYLGRGNGEYDAPRSILGEIVGHSSNSSLSEMPMHKEKGLCCGAGGGHFWMDMKVGERINVQRVNQAEEVNATTIATGCPFCLHMLEDGLKLTNREEKVRVRDIAEILAEEN